mgnify:CR=1 FL=1
MLFLPSSFGSEITYALSANFPQYFFKDFVGQIKDNKQIKIQKIDFINFPLFFKFILSKA